MRFLPLPDLCKVRGLPLFLRNLTPEYASPPESLKIRLNIIEKYGRKYYFLLSPSGRWQILQMSIFTLLSFFKFSIRNNFLSATSLRLFAVENFDVGSSGVRFNLCALGYIPREGGAFIRITCARSIVWNISRVRDISVSCNLPPRKNESRLITNGESRLVMLFPSFRNRGWKYLSKSSLNIMNYLRDNLMDNESGYGKVNHDFNP